MKTKLLKTVIFRGGRPYISYGFRITRYFGDISFDKAQVKEFIKILEEDPDPLANIDWVIEDFFSSPCRHKILK